MLNKSLVLRVPAIATYLTVRAPPLEELCKLEFKRGQASRVLVWLDGQGQLDRRAWSCWTERESLAFEAHLQPPNDQAVEVLQLGEAMGLIRLLPRRDGDIGEMMRAEVNRLDTLEILMALGIGVPRISVLRFYPNGPGPGGGFIEPHAEPMMLWRTERNYEWPFQTPLLFPIPSGTAAVMDVP